MRHLESDRITTLDVLRHARRPDIGFDADGLLILDRLQASFPQERLQVLRWAVQRELKAGHLDKGVSLLGAWLTQAGIAKLVELEKADYPLPMKVSNETSGKMLPF